MKVCSIHQPNFFPWLGFFDKIKKSDIFVFMDNVERPHSHGSWVNQVMLNYNNNAKFFTAPISRQKSREMNSLMIKDAYFDENQNWRAKMLKMLKINYSKSKNYLAIIDFIELIIMNPESNIANYNINAIEQISKLLKINTTFIRQSEIINVNNNLSATPLIVNIIKNINVKKYICGNGYAKQQDELFKEANIELIYQNFIPKPYGNPEKFIPGLSIIDYMMNESITELII